MYFQLRISNFRLVLATVSIMVQEFQLNNLKNVRNEKIKKPFTAQYIGGTRMSGHDNLRFSSLERAYITS